MTRMNILVSNDDGYQAMGIRVLTQHLDEVANTHVVAPDRNRSGASNSLTLDSPIRAFVGENGFIGVDGTPTDCVHLAITGLLAEEPDMVISGINHGANMGDDVLYSGTVAAAMEGRFLGLPAIAVSLVCDENPRYFDTAARVIVELLSHLQQMPLDRDTILNVNVPDLPYDHLTGMEVTRLGHRHKSEAVIKMDDPRGRPVYWVGPCGAEADAGDGTDFNAIREARVSITPIHTDLTQFSALEKTRAWLEAKS